MHDETPTARVLTVLERLQDRAETPGPELAEAVGVDVRTVRRYVALLQSLGIPVEARRGPAGGYRVGSGYRMPPLMLTTEQAVAVALLLMSGAPDESSAAAAALAKIVRVLPRGTAERVETVRAAITGPAVRSVRPDRVPRPDVLMTICEAVVAGRRCVIRHRSDDETVTSREVNPYGVVSLRGAWYLHAWCHLRQARRTFRLDKIESARLLDATFSTPAGLDVVAAVQQSLALSRPEWQVQLLVEAPIDELRHWIARDFALLTAAGEGSTLMRASTSSLDYFVWRIGDLPFELSVVEPPELAEAFARNGERLAKVARRYAGRHD